MNKPIFISHAVKDKPLADALVDLFQVGMNLGSDKVFCSSLEGLGIPAGENFVHYIKSQIQHPKVVIALISPNYLSSQFCMCELGASWAMSHRLFPLLVPPLKYSDVQGVLTGIQLTVVNDSDRLSEFMDLLLATLSETRPPTARWEVKRDKFVKEVGKILKKLGSPTTVPAAEHAKLQQDLKDAKSALAESEDERERLESLVKDLSKVKDKTQVLTIKKAHQPAVTTLAELELALRDNLNDFHKSVAFVAFNELGLGQAAVIDPFKDREFAEQIQDAASKKLVSIDEFGHCSLNNGHPKVRKLIEAFKSLETFLQEDCPAELVESFEHEHQFPLDLENRDYWEYALDTRIAKVYA